MLSSWLVWLVPFSSLVAAFIDLFAGIGGLRLGYSNATRDTCVFRSEIDPHSQATYAANFGETPHGDITKIDPRSIPKFDTLLAGPPCQAFSNAGQRKGFDDPRGAVFWSMVPIIDYHRPRTLLVENVRGLLSHDKGNTFRAITETLKSLGYQVFSKVLNAKDFGLAQNRARIYIVAFNRRTKFCFPSPTFAATRVGDILESDVDPKYTISDRAWSGHQARLLRNRAAGKGFGYTMVSADSKHTNTLTARYGKDGSEILIDQDVKNPRRLTPREAARLQGIPESFILPLSDNLAYHQLGNSVPVPVIEAISRKMKDAVDVDARGAAEAS
jgi:DNA (cytosine-5)-methyltransferase 1